MSGHPHLDMSSNRKSINVTLSNELLRQASEYEVDVSQACEAGLAKVVANERRRRWLKENRRAMEEWNRYIDEHGIPLADYRQF